jgi:hypothetical protein
MKNASMKKFIVVEVWPVFMTVQFRIFLSSNLLSKNVKIIVAAAVAVVINFICCSGFVKSGDVPND